MQTRFIVSILAIGLLAGCQGKSAVRDWSAGNVQPAADEWTARLHVMGMSCPLCADNIDQQLMKIPGVQGVLIDLGTGVVQARLSPKSPPTREQLTQAIAQSGFTLDRIEMPKATGGDHE